MIGGIIIFTLFKLYVNKRCITIYKVNSICMLIVSFIGMVQYFKILLPFLETTPISRSELIMRFRSHFDTTNGKFKALLNLLYGVQFTEISKRGNEVVIYD
jgi:hypothetical protein